MQALKRRWEERRKAEGKSTEKPNIVMGNNVQVVGISALLRLTPHFPQSVHRRTGRGTPSDLRHEPGEK